MILPVEGSDFQSACDNSLSDDNFIRIKCSKERNGVNIVLSIGAWTFDSFTKAMGMEYAGFMQTQTRSGKSFDDRAVNRRAFPRWFIPFEVRLGTGGFLDSAEALEIGEGGMSFRSRKILPIESIVDIEFRLHPSDEWTKVKVMVRYSGAGKLGVEFLNLRLVDRVRIVDCVSATA